jgi:hypothetical protein
MWRTEFLHIRGDLSPGLALIGHIPPPLTGWRQAELSLYWLREYCKNTLHSVMSETVAVPTAKGLKWVLSNHLVNECMAHTVPPPPPENSF